MCRLSMKNFKEQFLMGFCSLITRIKRNTFSLWFVKNKPVLCSSGSKNQTKPALNQCPLEPPIKPSNYGVEIGWKYSGCA